MNYRNPDGYKPVAIPKALKVISGYKEDLSMGVVNPGNVAVQIISLAEKKYVGIPVTATFQNVSGIGEANRTFMANRGKIENTVRTDEYVCLHFANKVAFTYIYSMEVSELKTIPDGMIGFSVPGSRYAKARSKDEDPYGLINAFLSENEIESSSNLFALEVFRFGEEESKYNADIFVPIKD